MPKDQKLLGTMAARDLLTRQGKPHIRPFEPQAETFYVCRGCGYSGIGVTPFIAWREWQFRMINGGGWK